MYSDKTKRCHGYSTIRQRRNGEDSVISRIFKCRPRLVFIKVKSSLEENVTKRLLCNIPCTRDSVESCEFERSRKLSLEQRQKAITEINFKMWYG